MMTSFLTNIVLGISAISITACGGGTGPAALQNAVLATTANLNSAGEGQTFTGNQVSFRQGFTGSPATANSIRVNDPSAHRFTATIDQADSETKANGASGAANGDGSARLSISGFANDVLVVTFAGDDDFETRSPTAPSTAAEQIVLDADRDIYVDVFIGLQGPNSTYQYVAPYYWYVANYNPTTNELTAVTVADGVLGFETPTGGLPTGSVNYVGTSYLRALDFTTGADVDGTFTTSYTINFGTGDFTGQNSQVEYAGTLNGAAITGTATSLTSGSSANEIPIGAVGDLTGTVYGPNGEEIGGAFQIIGPDGAVIGTFLGQL